MAYGKDEEGSRDDEDYAGGDDLAYDTWKDNQAEIYFDLKRKINEIKSTCERWRIKFEKLLE